MANEIIHKVVIEPEPYPTARPRMGFSGELKIGPAFRSVVPRSVHSVADVIEFLNSIPSSFPARKFKGEENVITGFQIVIHPDHRNEGWAEELNGTSLPDGRTIEASEVGYRNEFEQTYINYVEAVKAIKSIFAEIRASDNRAALEEGYGVALDLESPHVGTSGRLQTVRQRLANGEIDEATANYLNWLQTLADRLAPHEQVLEECREKLIATSGMFGTYSSNKPLTTRAAVIDALVDDGFPKAFAMAVKNRVPLAPKV